MSRTRRSHRPPTSDTRLARDKSKERRERRREDRKRARVAEGLGYRASKSCGRKARFATVQEAMEQADKVRALYGETRALSAYRCEICGGWHLTSHPAEG